MEKAWQSFVTTLGDRSWGEQCPTMGVIGVHGGQCGGFHSWGRRHFIQIKSVSQHPAEREEALIEHPLVPGFPSGAHPPLAPIHPGARVTVGHHPCPGTYGRLSLLWLSLPSHAMRKQDFCLGKPRSSSRSETRSRT